MRARNALPAEGVVAWATRFKLIEPRYGFRQIGPMPGRNPPQHQRGFDRLKPFAAAATKTPMQRLPDEALKRLDVFPNGKVRQNARVVIDRHVHGMTTGVLQTPDETIDLLRELVHTLDVLDKLGHARIVERIANPRDVELGQMTGAGHCHS